MIFLESIGSPLIIDLPGVHVVSQSKYPVFMPGYKNTGPWGYSSQSITVCENSSMWDILHSLKLSVKSTASSFSNISISSSRRSSLSSSRPEFRPVHSDIIRRNLVTDFLEATSLPVNVPIHRSREAASPSHSMKEEYDRCTKQLPGSLATKLFHSPPQVTWEAEEEEEEEGEERERRKLRSKRKLKKNMNQQPELMFLLEM